MASGARGDLHRQKTATALASGHEFQCHRSPRLPLCRAPLRTDCRGARGAAVARNLSQKPQEPL
jgi:hypothetical protein